MTPRIRKTENAPLILVVGMHRSGTSLLGSLMKKLGVSLPGELIEADIYNPSGYHERHDVTGLQEQLLIELGRWWPGPSGGIPLPADWLQMPCTRRVARQLGALLKRESEQQQGPWAIKDPRSSLLLPMWRYLCTEYSIPLRLVHAIRDPSEVVRSLLQRDREAAGMTEKRAQQLWWYHNTQIIHDGFDLPHITIHYERWFSPQAMNQMEALGSFCTGQAPNKKDLEAARTLIKPEYRRSLTFDSSTLAIHRNVQRLRRALESDRSFSKEEFHPPSWRTERSLLSVSPLPRKCRLVIVGYGATTCHWSIHVWLQRCSLPHGFALSEHPNATPVGLHLQPVELTEQSGALKQLQQLRQVFDPCLKRVLELRRLGVHAFWIDPLAPSNGWLEKAFDVQTASHLFGLPDPSVLASNGSLLCLGSGGDEWERQLKPPVWGLPSFDQLHIANSDAARVLAAWLNACNRSGLQLVRIKPSDYEKNSQPFYALDQPREEATLEWLPPVLLDECINSEFLMKELEYRRERRTSPPSCVTPKPTAKVLWDKGARGATAAVCISLFNYADRIINALESVRRQTHEPLELIIVDDKSTDGGDLVTYEWLEKNGKYFHRSIFLQHERNGGLAAARNSAFSAASADWCFVLDADNTLESEAISLCLKVARTSPQSTAVVHPLVELRSESALPGQPMQVLLTRIAWQRHALQHGNQIDAAALVRRSHWEAVEGYTHIPGGWEDYDFWCKLIDSNLHGVICPQRLVVYNRHRTSMQATYTLQQLSDLKQILTARHPWLQL